MGTIKTGFWKLGFILSPNEFEDFIKYCISLNIKPNSNDICEQYKLFYTELTAMTQPSNYMKRDNISYIDLRAIVSGLKPENGRGFVINPATMVHWPHYKKAVRISSWATQITLQKSISIDKEDEKGKYFEYEDINIHSPQSYPLYEQITDYIKKITKPLRFNAYVVDNVEEIKPPVRISKQVATDLANSWIFKEYEFEMKTKIT